MSDLDSAAFTCQQRLCLFFQRVDSGRYEAAAALFHPDAIWEQTRRRLAGIAEITAALNGRSTSMVALHLLSTLHAQATDADTVDVTGYLTLYRHDDGKVATRPAPLPGPSLVTTCHARFKRDGAGWRMVHLTTPVVFRA